MKWSSHRVVGFCGALLLTLNPFAAALSMWASTIPDKIEGDGEFSGGRKPSRGLLARFLAVVRRAATLIGLGWIFRHRGLSHDLAAWSLVSAAVWLAATRPGSPWLSLACSGILLGILSHLLADMLTMTGIPVAGKRVALRLFATGSWREYFVVWVLVVPATAARMAAFLLHDPNFARFLRRLSGYLA